MEKERTWTIKNRKILETELRNIKTFGEGEDMNHKETKGLRDKCKIKKKMGERGRGYRLLRIKRS